MSLLLLFGGASGVVSVTPIAFGTTLAILMPDECPVGQAVNVYTEAFDDVGTKVLDEAAQIYVWGFTTAGVRTVEYALTAMTQVGASNLWTSGGWTPTVAGTYEVVVVAKTAGTAYPVTRAITVRPQFDPIGLAVDDVLVSRMGNDATLGTH